MTPTGEDEGSVAPLVIVLFVIAAAFVAVVAGATALHLERLRLLTVADDASLAAAESFRVRDVTVDGDEVRPSLDGGRVAAAAAESVGAADRGDLDGLRVVASGTTDGRVASVTVAAVWRPPLISRLLPVALPIEATSTAAARFG